MFQISSHVRGSPFEKDMEYKLSEMALLIRPLTCFSLTLDNLAKSKEILIEVFLVLLVILFFLLLSGM